VAVALIVAAGSGERLGLGRPKAFLPLAGRPMLQWSVDALRAVPEIERIVVALPEGERAPEGTIGVPGGGVRSESVRRALAAAGGLDPVLVHDAARPLLTPSLAAAVLRALDGVDAAIAAAPVTDTVKQAGADHLVTATLDRSRLWSVQTPQAFTLAALGRAAALPGDRRRLAGRAPRWPGPHRARAGGEPEGDHVAGPASGRAAVRRAGRRPRLTRPAGRRPA